MIITKKVCPRPGCNSAYNEKYTSKYCDICGATLLIEENKIEKLNININDIINPKNQDKSDDIEKDKESFKESDKTSDIEDKIINFENTDKVNDTENQIKNCKNLYKNDNVEKENQQPVFTIDSKGFIHFTEFENEEKLDGDKIIVYLGQQIYKEFPIEYDETIIGRYSVKSTPDIDLSEIDPEGYTSRRHMMIYKEDGKFYARNLSAKNSVHIERDVLKQGESKELKDNDLIILSKYIVMVFKKKK